MQATQGVKTAVEVCAQTTGAVAGCGTAGNGAVSVAALGATGGANVSAVAVDANGVILATGSGAAPLKLYLSVDTCVG
ncbi:hypothetical protein [Aliamphritea ceti]|uniref:hypothetical protein n=1 Tax=Aliamphritea ceti TaxID=1524258 RepID=UPI0021C28CD2|nr:hypothetical protein [Aliamphritea ceti]